MADKKRSVSIVIEAKNRADAALKSVGLSLGGVAAAAAAATAVLATIGAVLKKAVDAASEQQEADVLLASSLRSVGQNTAEAREHFAEFINTLQFASRFTDEAIGSVLASLIPLQKYGVNVEGATQALVDYAAFTRQDVTAATEGFINVIVKGTGRMARINTKFAEGTTVAEKYSSVIRQMKGFSEGTAAALASTFAGALDQINKHIETQMENLGKTIIVNKAVQDALRQTAKSIDQAGGAVNSTNKEFAGLVTVVGKLWETLLQAGPALMKVGASVLAMTPGIGGAVSAFRGLWSMLGLVHTETVNLEEDLGNAGAGLTDLGNKGEEALSPLDAALKKLGTDTLADLNKKAALVNETFALMNQAMAQGTISPERFSALREQISEMAVELQKAGVSIDKVFETITVKASEMHGFLAGALEASRQSINEQITLQQEMAETLGRDVVAGAGAAADALVDAAMGAKVEWGQLFRQILADMAKAIIKALIMRAIFAAITGGAGGAGLGGAHGALSASAGGVGFMASGGEVRGGTPGLDSVAAMLTPGEIVLPASRAQDFEDMAAVGRAFRDGSRGGGGTDRPALVGSLTIVPRRDERDLAEIVEGITRLVERRGYRLVASEVRG